MTAVDRHSQPHDAISQRAASFFERRRFAEWSDADQAELDSWLAESAAHRVALLRVEGIVARTARLAALRPPKPEPRPAGIVPAVQMRPNRRRWILPLLAAASVALIVGFGVPYLRQWMEPPDRTYSTDVGGRALLSFADHTQIELNTNSLIRYHMTNEERTVWLERGEAWFRVAHDASNPFTVVVGRHRVTDLGTEFTVRRGTDGMEVTLLKGRAALSTEGAQTAMLVPGDDAVATRVSFSMTRKSAQQLADELAWKHGMLVFRNTRLVDVVREFNRYNAIKLVIADPSIDGLKFSAELKTDDFEGFLQLAQAVLHLRADREGNDILISRASELRSVRRQIHASSP